VMMDQELDNFYQSEKRMLTIFLVFTGVAIFIGCLGLYGLVSYLAHRKVKEIGIRKVLGASVGQIILSFSREFVVLVMVGFALAAPIAWYLLNLWLTTFAYRIAWGGWIFAAGLGFTLVVALLTVGYRSVRAALANPVEAISNE
jgi:putative ABC transport system permease protein